MLPARCRQPGAATRAAIGCHAGNASTTYRITDAGRAAFEGHRTALRALLDEGVPVPARRSD